MRPRFRNCYRYKKVQLGLKTEIKLTPFQVIHIGVEQLRVLSHRHRCWFVILNIYRDKKLLMQSSVSECSVHSVGYGANARISYANIWYSRSCNHLQWFTTAAVSRPWCRRRARAAHMEGNSKTFNSHVNSLKSTLYNLWQGQQNRAMTLSIIHRWQLSGSRNVSLDRSGPEWWLLVSQIPPTRLAALRMQEQTCLSRPTCTCVDSQHTDKTFDFLARATSKRWCFWKKTQYVCHKKQRKVPPRPAVWSKAWSLICHPEG